MLFKRFHKSDMVCKICNNSEKNQVYKVKEMMLGLNEIFKYFECSRCGCLQIAQVPSNLSKYYPKEYYSFKSPYLLIENDNTLKLYLDKLRDLNESNNGEFDSPLFSNFPDEAMQSLAFISLKKNSRILDIGCGAGHQLFLLKYIGFQNLLGIDLYIERDIKYENGLTILKCSLNDMVKEGSNWDLIIFNHSFEHFPNPIEVIQNCKNILAKNGTCLIRIPIVSSYAWKYYRTNWVQLDAPRHFFLHSVASMKLLAENAGLKIRDIIFDSTEFQFWGSEQYVKKIPLFSEKSLIYGEGNSMFSSSDILLFQQKANQLNEEKQGDQAAFFLERD